MKKQFLLFMLLCMTCLMSSKAQETTPAERLFHITRTLNADLVCYDVNLKDGKLNTKEPIHVYWLNRTEHPGRTNELNMLQRKLAYGYKVVSKGDDTADIKLTAYNKRAGHICKQGDKYILQLDINNQKCQLTEIFVKSRGKMGRPEYIELIGTSLKDGSRQVERINP